MGNLGEEVEIKCLLVTNPKANISLKATVLSLISIYNMRRFPYLLVSCPILQYIHIALDNKNI